MNIEERPSPEKLLEIFKREESQRLRGKLKIFLGMAAGVGKTYSMLEAAQNLRREGIDIVVGVVDTHGRTETAKLLEGLEIIPLKTINYKEATFEEMDLDAILKRKPQLVLVDELAHSNVPGSRHLKRWQDVVEILDHAIDVYTTLNVQHIESLKDVVERIAGIIIRETVPDLVIETANFIELIDLTPNELLRRLNEGKVYLGGQSVIAAQNFFQEDRLTALREIVLRYAAEKVDHDLKGMFSTAQRSDAWKPRERLLVAISQSPHSQKLIRITRRLAFNLDAPWIAVNVDDGSVLDESERETLAKNLALARDLGAEVITISAPDLALAIQRIARQKSVTQIIIGRSPKSWLDFFQRNSLLDRLAKECSDIDLHVIRQTLYTKRFRKKFKLSLKSSASSYLLVLVFVLGLALFNGIFLSALGYKVAGFIFLLGILFLSLFFKKGPIFFASILYALIWVIFFIPEQESSPFSLKEDIILLALYLVTAIFTGVLTDRARKHTELLSKRERSIEALYEITREIATSPSFDQILLSVKDRLSSVLEGRCEILIKKLDNGLIFDGASSLIHNEKEKAAANWVFQNSKEAGWSTSTLPFAQNLYIPLKGSNEVMGVLAYRPNANKELTIEEKNFFYTVGQQLANYLERRFSEQKARLHEQHKQVEKIYQSILNLIANLFEGPLLTIQDATKELQKIEIPGIEERGINPLEHLTTATESLTRILENISAMVNLSAGLTPVNREKYNIKDLLTTSCERLKKTTPNYRFDLKVEEELPEIYFDYDLIELLFYNLAFHAMEFSPPESTIKIECERSGDYVIMTVSGEGQAVPPEMLDVAFEKFYRLPGTTSSGLGLGLAIAKVIAEIHNGELKILSRPSGGMMFSLYLPIT